ncbi:hypothetical protein [Vibrio sp. WXL210]|uniref:hypothetical protein n=1 Tax=Vibrio sp. WXL210 TaxID=3450709 RepID=UPI003EC53BC3
MKKLLTLTAIASTLVLTGCADPSEDQIAQYHQVNETAAACVEEWRADSALVEEEAVDAYILRNLGTASLHSDVQRSSTKLIFKLDPTLHKLFIASAEVKRIERCENKARNIHNVRLEHYNQVETFLGK